MVVDWGVFISGALLGLAALTAICYMLWVLFQGIRGNISGPSESKKLLKRRRILADAKALVEADAAAQAYPQLRKAFLLDHLQESEDLINRVYDHHLGILGVLISISKNRSISLANLPTVEELLQVHCGTMKAFYSCQATRATLLQKNKGKKDAKWAVDGLNEKLRDLKADIEENRRRLEGELGRLFSALQENPKEREIQYH